MPADRPAAPTGARSPTAATDPGGGRVAAGDRTPVLAAVEVWKHYGGVRALAGVSLGLVPGEVHALIGENGAGKSTLVKVLAGVVRPDGGRLELAGEPARFSGPLDAQRQGVAIVSQELS